MNWFYCLKDFFELVYYIAFIILTYLIVKYAIKTYAFQTEKSFKLYCKCYVDENSRHTHGFRFGIEIFNYGNDIAENIIVELEEKQIAQIDFIKPNESFFFPLGEVGQMMAGNYIYLDNTDGHTKPDVLNIALNIDDARLYFTVKLDLLYAYRSNIEGDLANVSKAITKSAQNICDTIDGKRLVHTSKH